MPTPPSPRSPDHSGALVDPAGDLIVGAQPPRGRRRDRSPLLPWTPGAAHPTSAPRCWRRCCGATAVRRCGASPPGACHNYGESHVAVEALAAAVGSDADVDVREMAAWSLAEADDDAHRLRRAGQGAAPGPESGGPRHGDVGPGRGGRCERRWTRSAPCWPTPAPGRAKWPRGPSGAASPRRRRRP